MKEDQAAQTESKSVEEQILDLRVQVRMLCDIVVNNGTALAYLNTGNIKKSIELNHLAVRQLDIYCDFIEGTTDRYQAMFDSAKLQGGAQ